MQQPPAPRLSDFTAGPRIAFMGAIAVGVGIFAAFVAWTLLRLIGLFTNLFYFQRWGTSLASPVDAHIGAWALVVPVAGGLIVGMMARYGSDRIRGHGIPEALEAILINKSRMEPRVALLKPLSSAIAIGSGGPFGAEGPIIMTGGAFGSLAAQHLHLTSMERRTLLAAGAAAGMSATFGAPLAAVLLAIELLLFEWRPRSFVPVALASAAAAAVRHYILGSGALFPIGAMPSFAGPGGLFSCALVGLIAGVASLALTGAVYAAEDAFGRLPVHWMWWPAIGGVAIGLGGLVFPEALGVGYGNIGALLGGDTSMRLIIGILLVKSAIWAISLGSGTSGGVLAPLLMIGAALGGLEARVLPSEAAGFWPLISMAAILGGTMRSPLMGIVFAVELTHNVDVMYPIALATFIAYGFTVVVMRRSILTEKVARRGYHVTCEYGVDPLELLLVRDVMQPAPAVAATNGHGATVPEGTPATLARPDEPVRQALQRMVESGASTLDVRDPGGLDILGQVSMASVLDVRKRVYDQEHVRDRRYGLPRIARRTRRVK